MGGEGDDGGNEAELPVGDNERQNLQRIADLTEAVNQSSSTARTNWIFLLALMAYLFVSVASVTHKDLLLDNPIKLPILNVEIPLSQFFLVAPFGFLVIYAGVLLQHALLADKCRTLDEAFSLIETEAILHGPRHHPSRLNLSTYFLTQIIAGRSLPIFRRTLSLSMMWITLGAVPLILLLSFQVAFLPFHDEGATLGHKIAVGIAATLSLLVAGMLAPACINRNLLLISQIVIVAAATVTAVTATVPGSFSDRLLASSTLLSRRVPIGDEDPWQQPRYAFWLTAMLFEGEVNYVTGKSTSLFSRNLIVPDAQLTAISEKGEQRVRGSLRNRDLRYAIFDRSDMSGIDFTGAKLNGASLRNSNLRGAKFRCERHGRAPNILEDARKWREEIAQRREVETNWSESSGTLVDAPEPNQSKDWLWLKTLVDESCMKAARRVEESAERCADLSDANLTGSDLRGSDIKRAALNRSVMSEANMRGVDMQSATVCDGRFASTKLEGADLSRSTMVGTSFGGASLHGANLSSANMTLASFWRAQLVATNLTAAWLHLADLRHANLAYADLSDAMLRAADLRWANLWSAAPPPTNALVLSDFSNAKHDQLNRAELDGLAKLVSSIADDSLPTSKFDRTKVPEKLAKMLSPDMQSATAAEAKLWTGLVTTLDRRNDASFYKRRKDLLGLVACRSPRAAYLLLSRYGHLQASAWYSDENIPLEDKDTELLEDPRILGELKAMTSAHETDFDTGYAEVYFFDDWLTPADLSQALSVSDCPVAKSIEVEHPGILAWIAENARIYRTQEAKRK